MSILLPCFHLAAAAHATGAVVEACMLPVQYVIMAFLAARKQLGGRRRREAKTGT